MCKICHQSDFRAENGGHSPLFENGGFVPTQARQELTRFVLITYRQNDYAKAPKGKFLAQFGTLRMSTVIRTWFKGPLT